MPTPRTATVIGSGPNGLAAAVVLAHAGLHVTVLEAENTIGGGTRSGEYTIPGVVHDHCSATHPLAQASPFFQEFGDALAAHGLRFATAPVDAVHILDHRRSATLHTSVAETAEGFSAHSPASGPHHSRWDARLWRSSFGPLAAHANDLVHEVLQPPMHLPRHPVLFSAFGLQALAPASWSWRRFATPETRALFAGIAAHAFIPLHYPGSSAAGTLLTTAGHAHGWPVAVGGSQAIADALVAEIQAHGGEVLTGHPVTGPQDLGDARDADLLLLDTSLESAASILGDRLPGNIARAWAKFRRGPGVAKVDYTIEGDIPWTATDAHHASTVHLGGTAEEIAAAEHDCWRGRLPHRPFTLICQQYLADPSRSAVLPDGRQLNPVWAYAHVPFGWTGTPQETFELVTRQIEDAAPGFRDRIIAHISSPPGTVAAENRNNIGGEISGGANDLWQLLARPRWGSDPYSTGVPGVYLCSSATAPGGGVHFMCGMNAARHALRASG